MFRMVRAILLPPLSACLANIYLFALSETNSLTRAVRSHLTIFPIADLQQHRACVLVVLYEAT